MAKLIPIPRMDEKQGGLTLADIAAKLSVLTAYADVDRVELLDGIAQLIGRRAKLRAEFHRRTIKPSEMVSALTEAERATANLMKSLVNMHALARVMDGPDEAIAGAVLAVPEDRRNAGIQLLLGVRRQSQQLSAIAAAAEALHALLADYLVQTTGDSPDIRADILRQEFLGQAAEAWTILTGKAAGKSKDGPFMRFAAALWLAANMPRIPKGDLRAQLGNAFQKMRK